MQNDKEQFKADFKKRVYAYTLRLIRFIETLPNDRVSGVLGKDQLLRSGTSVLANLSEARAASSKKDFINYFTHSLKSCNETKLWLTLLCDLKRGDEHEVTWLLQETTEIGNIIASSILTMKGRK